MKRIALYLYAICITTYAFAQTETINWYVDGQTYSTSTCETGADINLPPTPPEKIGYTFVGWGEYIPLEYIETTGTQAFELSFPLQKDMRFEYDISITSSWDFSIGFTDIGMTFNRYFKLYNKKHTYSPCNIALDRQKHTLIYDAYNDIAGVDNCYKSMNGDMDDYTGYFRISIAGKYLNDWQIFYRYPARHYGVRFYERDVLVRDYVPALDKNGTPCMYEKIQKKFYYKNGNDSLIAGPIIDE